LKVIVPHK
jgi:hypothetical protein